MSKLTYEANGFVLSHHSGSSSSLPLEELRKAQDFTAGEKEQKCGSTSPLSLSFFM